MKISYFANKKLERSDIVSIAIGKPKFAVGMTDGTLAPTWEMVNRGYGREEYWALLESRKVNPYDIVKRYQNKVLCCFEKENSNCHRLFLAEWLTKKTGEVIEEV